MAAPSVSKETWAKVRAIWEADPVITFEEIAKSIGMTRQGVRQRAGREKWQKDGNSMVIEGKAHRVADSKVTENPVDPENQGEEVYGADPAAPSVREADTDRTLPAIPDGAAPHEVRQIVTDAADAKRAALIERHRHELGAIRAQLYAAVKKAGTKDGLNQARTAKTLVEAFASLQGAERQAWGMGGPGHGNKPGEPPQAATIIVHQQAGVKLG